MIDVITRIGTTIDLTQLRHQLWVRGFCLQHPLKQTMQRFNKLFYEQPK